MAERVVDLMPCDVMFGGVDVREPVVRCRDCAFSIAGGSGCGRWKDFIEVAPDGFCAWGERKGEKK